MFQAGDGGRGRGEIKPLRQNISFTTQPHFV